MKDTSQQLVQDRIRELRENTDFVSTLLESLVGYAIIAADFDGNVIAFNEGARQIYGYAPEEVIGKQEMQIFFPEDFIEAGKLQQIIGDLIEQGRFSYEGEKVRKNGDKFPAQVLFTLTKDKSGKVVGFIEIVADLTERKRAEEALRVSRASFHNVVDKSADGAIVVDRKGVVRFVNPAGKRLVTEPKAKQLLSIGELFGRPIVAGDVMEVEIIRGDGEIGIAEMRVVDTEWEGGNAYLVSLRDITERKRAEEKLRELDRMKSEFLSNVSHELRTPLHSIKGFTKLMLEGKVPDPEIQKEFLSTIDKQSEHLGVLINGLLDMSRLESSRFTIQKQCLSIKDIVHETVESFYSLASDKGTVINEDIPVTLPEIDADRERVRQVMVNLLSNAIKFSNNGSGITVKGEVKDRELLVQVTDRGIGIPEEAIPHLFERFYRAPDSMARGGAGLGLYISKQIIEAHGGRIWAESKVGQGSTFSFTLPVHQAGGDSDE